MLTVSDNHIVLGGGGGGGGSTTFVGLSDKATADLPGTNTPLANALSGKEATSNKKTDVDANKTSDTFFPSIKAVFDWVSGLFVTGAVSSTDDAIARFDGTTGKLVQNSSVIVTDAGNIGIGTTALDAKFVIRGGDGSTYSSGMTIAATGGNVYAVYPTVNDLRFRSVTAGLDVIVFAYDGNIGIGTMSPTANCDVNGTSRFRDSSTFNGQIIDNAGSSGTDGQVLKKVGGLVVWANP